MASRLTALSAPLGRRPNPASIDRWRRCRVAIAYRWRHGRWPDLHAPRRFTEWVQWRKLNDRDRGLARLTDKLHAKAIAAAVLGDDLVVPTLWQGDALPIEPPAPFPLVVKANHGCGQWRVVANRGEWARVRRVAAGWLRASYGQWLDEWHYREATPALLVEPFVGEPGCLPIDYKIYVFGGRAAVVQVHEARATRHRWAQHDREWRLLSAMPTGVDRPVSLDRMIDAAERLAAGRDFLRVDFYEVDGRPLFGEFCLYPGSGLDRFDPDAIDLALGDLWSDARATRC